MASANLALPQGPARPFCTPLGSERGTKNSENAVNHKDASRSAREGMAKLELTGVADCPRVSVVVPVYDEADSIAELHARIIAALGDDVEIVFVDDGSRDASKEVLTELAERPLTRVFGFRRNYGKSHALSVGFARSRGERIATLDADLQDDPAEIPALIAKLDEGYDLVGGWRRTRHDSGAKVFGSRIFNRVVGWVARVRFRDINCGLKVFRRDVVEEIRLSSGYHRFLPLLAHWKGFRVTEGEVTHHPRRHGRSRYGKGRVLRALSDLAVLVVLERFEGRPGRYVAGAGFTCIAEWRGAAHGPLRSPAHDWVHPEPLPGSRIRVVARRRGAAARERRILRRVARVPFSQPDDAGAGRVVGRRTRGPGRTARANRPREGA